MQRRDRLLMKAWSCGFPGSATESATTKCHPDFAHILTSRGLLLYTKANVAGSHDWLRRLETVTFWNVSELLAAHEQCKALRLMKLRRRDTRSVATTDEPKVS